MEYIQSLNKKEILPYATIWMNLENTMPSETRQTQEDRYCKTARTEASKIVKLIQFDCVTRGWGGSPREEKMGKW